MRRALLALALAALTAAALVVTTGPARAQTVRLYLQRLASRPAEILLVPGFLTILEFEDAVNAVATGNPSVVELVDVTGGTVMLRPRSGSGATDIVVSVSDVRALFRARVAGQPRTTHKYVISSAEPPEGARADTTDRAQPARPATQTAVRAPATRPTPAPAPAQQATTEWDRFVATLTPAQQALLLDLMRELSFAKLFEFLQTLSPQQRETFLRLARFRGLQPQAAPAQPARPEQPAPAAPVTRPPAQQAAQAGSGPDWIDWQVVVQRTPSGTVVQYTLTNSGQRTVLTDILRLRVTSPAGEVKFAVSRVNPSGYAGRINPGEAESGTIALQGDPGGPVTLEWRVVEVGSGAVYTLTRTVQ